MAVIEKKNKEKKAKSKKPLLILGLVLLAAALLVGGGFFITSSIVFARNAIALLLLGGAGVGIATPIVKGINRLINGNTEKTENVENEREYEREQTREEEREEEREEINIDRVEQVRIGMEDIPQEQEGYVEDPNQIEMEILPAVKKAPSQGKKR